MTANIADVFGFGRRMPSKLCVWMAVVHLLIGVALNDATNGKRLIGLESILCLVY